MILVKRGRKPIAGPDWLAGRTAGYEMILVKRGRKLLSDYEQDLGR